MWYLELYPYQTNQENEKTQGKPYRIDFGFVS